MYKYSVPISIKTVNESSLPVYLKEFKEGGIERVFLVGCTPIYREDSPMYTYGEALREAIAYFKSNGLEAGVWVGGFGHGVVLTHESAEDDTAGYQRIIGADGKDAGETWCPLDSKFADDYMRGIEFLAGLKPDIIMLDDDFRLNLRGAYSMGCACPLHMREFCERVGEDIPRENLERLVFSGEKNRYRTEWYKLMKDTLYDFALRARRVVDGVDKNIRLGFCACYDTWDFSGTDGIELTYAFAGNTAPFLRTISPPYHYTRVATAVEQTRMQAEWCKGSGIELFAEGDVYPRPRHNVPSRLLEIYDMALLVTGELDGILKYMYCYDHPIDYEKGYINAHLENKEIRQELASIFKDKHAVGVRVFEKMHKTEDWILPNEAEKGIARRMQDSFYSRAQMLLAQNAIPTTYTDSDTVIVFGENARYLESDVLKKGAILDVEAAKILMRRGIDTGIIDSEVAHFDREIYPESNDSFATEPVLHRMSCKEGVRVLSTLMPHGSIGSYLYENGEGLRFYVLAYDAYKSEADNDRYAADYFCNFYRQEHIQKAVEWISGRPLEAVCKRNPFLYTIVSDNSEGTRRSVALFNVFPDGISEPTVTLDREYSGIRFVNCTGDISGRTVRLSPLEPYGYAAFEVSI